MKTIKKIKKEGMTYNVISLILLISAIIFIVDVEYTQILSFSIILFVLSTILFLFFFYFGIRSYPFVRSNIIPPEYTMDFIEELGDAKCILLKTGHWYQGSISEGKEPVMDIYFQVIDGDDYVITINKDIAQKVFTWKDSSFVF